MESARDFIVDFLDINNEIPFEKVFWFILIYIFSLWAVISIWVFFDARKRYDNDITSFLFALLVFLLNFPMLIFYFAVRPDIRFDDFDDWEAGGVNVPIINFMGKEGIEMSFELRINPKKLRDSDKRPDMNVEIGWDNDDEKFRLIDRDELAKQILGTEETEGSSKKEPGKLRFVISNYFDKVSGNVKKSVTYMQSKVKDKSQPKSDKEDSKVDDKKDENVKTEEKTEENKNTQHSDNKNNQNHTNNGGNGSQNNQNNNQSHSQNNSQKQNNGGNNQNNNSGNNQNKNENGSQNK